MPITLWMVFAAVASQLAGSPACRVERSVEASASMATLVPPIERTVSQETREIVRSRGASRASVAGRASDRAFAIERSEAPAGDNLIGRDVRLERSTESDGQARAITTSNIPVIRTEQSPDRVSSC